MRAVSFSDMVDEGYGHRLTGTKQAVVADQGVRTKIALGPGEVHVAVDPSLVWMVLGSCVAVVLFVPDMKASALCHAQLPAPTVGEGRCDTHCPKRCLRRQPESNRLKFVTCCVEYMLDALACLGAPKAGIKACVFGGASVLPHLERRRSVGDLNVDAAHRILEQHGIAAGPQRIGGSRGRTLTYQTDTGKFGVRLHRASGE